jgi:hypothetical protein
MRVGECAEVPVRDVAQLRNYPTLQNQGLSRNQSEQWEVEKPWDSRSGGSGGSANMGGCGPWPIPTSRKNARHEAPGRLSVLPPQLRRK